jgi:hypothetical protein
MSDINKKWSYRNAKGQFVKKTVVEGVQKYYDKVKIESYKPESIIQEIKNLDLKKLAKIAKKGNQDRDYDAIYKDNKKRWVSNRDIENIRQYYLKEVPPDKQPESLRDEIRTWSRDQIKNFSNLGAGMFVQGAQMYLADGALPTYIDITTDQRLALAKKEKSKFFIGDQQVTLAKLRDAIRIHSQKEQDIAEKEGKNWYKTLVYLEYNRNDNTLTWDLKENASDIIKDFPKPIEKK